MRGLLKAVRECLGVQKTQVPDAKARSPRSDKKPRTPRQQLGDAGEQAACDYLLAQGFRIVIRNWRKGSLELDVVCLDRYDRNVRYDRGDRNIQNIRNDRGDRNVQSDRYDRGGRDTLVFVEVRTRAAGGKLTPAESLTPAKQRTFLRAVRAYLAETEQWAQPCRCDLVCVTAQPVASEHSGERQPDSSFTVEYCPDVLDCSALDRSVGGGHTPWQPW